MLELLIVRHGMSVRNHYTDLAFEGDTTLLDVHLREGKDEASWPLWKDGEFQARKTGQWLRDTYDSDFDATYSSPFLRAIETAQLFHLEGAEWKIEPRIRERYWGAYGPETDPLYTTREYMDDIHKCGYPTWRNRLPGSEAIVDLYPLAESFLRDTFQAVPQGRVLVVTHGGTMRAMQMVLDRIPIDQPERLNKIRTENCSILQYTLHDLDAERGAWQATRKLITPWLGQFGEA